MVEILIGVPGSDFKVPSFLGPTFILCYCFFPLLQHFSKRLKPNSKNFKIAGFLVFLTEKAIETGTVQNVGHAVLGGMYTWFSAI